MILMVITRYLGIPTTASITETKSAYKRKVFQLHPDRNKNCNSTQEFQNLNEAYNINLAIPQHVRNTIIIVH